MTRNIVALFGAWVVLMTSCDLDFTSTWLACISE